jgi:hypothetical protein
VSCLLAAPQSSPADFHSSTACHALQARHRSPRLQAGHRTRRGQSRASRRRARAHPRCLGQSRPRHARGHAQRREAAALL